MRRRQFLTLGGSSLAVALAGCGREGAPATASAGGNASTSQGPARTTTARFPDRPDGIYVQTFSERMSTQGTTTAGDYGFGLMFTVPHTFWTVTGTDLNRVEPTESDAIHLMASVWDPETRTVLPESGLSVEISRDGDLVSEEVIYPMLSQPMGFHYGGNFGLDGDGTYTVEVSVGGSNLRHTGTFEGRFRNPASAAVGLAFTEASRREVSTRPLDRGGQRGALRPMETAFPRATVPAAEQFPGTVRGSAMTDDARFVVTTFEDGSRVGEPGKDYLAVSARTRYNRYVLPAMALSATIRNADREVLSESGLERTLSPDLGYHYGAAVDSIQSGDELTLSVSTPPQVARHEGYETAFLQMDDVTVPL